MRNKLLLSASLVFTFFNGSYAQNCDINASASPITITCGQSTSLSAFGSSAGQVVLDEDFNTGGFGPGWGSTPGATSFSNPCSPNGVDNTPHAWMDNNTSVPRTLTSAPYDLTSATAGVSICFDLLFAEQGDAAPCEGPDEPDEGVFLQYSIDGGTTWIDIHYFDPNGGNDPQLTNWNNWCFDLPPGAITGNTLIRWHQSADSGADYDHWGIDNVQIFQNDINAEVEWLHDGYSYGVGSAGGVNPNSVSPTTTTTYTAQITTGTGDVCTADVTVIVIDPVYDVNVVAAPSTICAGDCATISGDAQIILDPGGIETYENAEVELITGTPGLPGFPPFVPPTPGSIEADMNINVVGINEPTVTSGLVTSVCINGFNIIPFGSGSVSLADVSIVLTCPSGTSITLANVGDLSGTTITNMCFQNGAAPISGGSAPYTGTFNPVQSLDALNGCDSEGVWNLTISGAIVDISIPFGNISGWNITFDDPPIYAPVDISWSPTADLSNPSSINTDACPASSTDYELTLSNGTAGCATYTETVSITVNPCGGCVPPVETINPLNNCAPGTVDLSTAIAAGSDPATLTYHATQADAQNDVNPIATAVGATGSYWVRAEDPTDGTCFNVYEIVVTIDPLDDASFTLTDYCAGSANAASGIVTPGGTFAFNPVPGGGVTIDAATGSITNGVSGTTYTVEYTTAGTCPATSTETIDVISQDDASFTLTNFCAGTANSATGIVTAGGTFTFNPVPSGGESIDGSTGEISNGIAGTTYTVEYTTAGTCPASSTETVDVTSQDDASFTLTDFCASSANAATGIATAGGVFTFNPVPSGGESIDAATGEISNGITGTTYTVEYTTVGACSASSTETVTVTSSDDASFTLTDFCAGTANSATGIATAGGTFTFNPVPGGGESIDGATGEITGGISGTTYTVEYTTVGACSASSTQTVTVTSSDDASFTLTDFCAGTANSATGIATAGGVFTFNPVPSGGESINGATGEITGGISGTTYTVEYTTAGACSASSTETVTVTSSDDASFTLTDFCAGAANAATGIVTAGGTFSFNPVPSGGESIDAATGEITNGIGGTTYTVEYTTGGTCSATSTETVDAQNCCNIVLDTTSTVAPSCGQADGEINVLAVGGDGTYTYSIDGGSFGASNSFTGLTAGTYQIEVQDGSGAACSDIIDVQITDLNAPIITAVNIVEPLCNGDATGEIEVIASGGFGALDYEIINGTPIANNATGQFTGLTAANYTVNVTDANGCIASSNGLITDPQAVSIDVQSTDVTCFGANDGTIDIVGGGGTPSYNYSIDNGVTWSTNTNYTGLSAQNYEVIVEDNNGCQSVVEDILINENGALVIDAVVIDETCFNSCDGQITLNVAGGNTPYSYSFNGGPAIISNVASNLCAGNQTYVVTDANGCSANGNDLITAGVRVEPVITSVVNDGCSDVCDGEVVVTSNTGVSYTLNGVTNATGVFTDLCEGNYTINVLDINDCLGTIQTVVSTTPQTDAEFSFLPSSVTVYESIVDFINTSNNATEYIWEITGDNGYYQTYTSENIEHEFPSDTGEYLVCLTAINPAGCQDQYCLPLVVEDEIVIYVPNTFTPDGDEFNQTFKAYVNGIDIYAFDFLIFNRWGELIWENNDPEVGWDGTYNGQIVQAGTYVWKIEVKDIEFDFRKTYTGHVTILK